MRFRVSSAVDVQLDENAAQQLTRRIARQLVDEHHVARNLVPGQVVLHVLLDLRRILGRAGFGNNEGAQPFSELHVVNTDHCHLGDIGPGFEQVLDLLGEHVLPAGNDHVVVAAVDEPASHCR